MNHIILSSDTDYEVGTQVEVDRSYAEKKTYQTGSLKGHKRTDQNV